MANTWLQDNIDALPTNSPSPVRPSVANPPVAQVQRPTPSPIQQGVNALTQAKNSPIGKAAVNVATAPQRVMTAGLGKIGEALAIPLNAFGGALTGARKATENYVKQNPKGSLLGGIGEGIKGGISGIGEGIKNKTTPGSYLTNTYMKDANPVLKAGAQLATDMTVDPMNLASFNTVRKGIGTVISPIAKGAEALAKSEPVQKMVQAAKESPLISKAIEATVNPYFRNPEVGKMIQGTQDVIKSRVANLYRMVDEANTGLSDAQKVRVGQLLEGGVSTGKTDKALVETANKFKELATQVGQEAVDAGLLDPKSFEKYKGQYMSHIWDITQGKNIGNTSEIPKIAGNFFKQRTGEQGYVKSFAAPVFKGLGTEMSDIEAAKLYKDIGQKYGKVPKNPQELADLAKQGYVYATDVAKSKGGEVLNNTLLPKSVVDYLKNRLPETRNDLTKVTDKIMGTWKAGKTLYNPAYHPRNIVSNQILSDIQTGKGLGATVIGYVKSVKDYLSKTPSQFVNEARDVGLIKNPSFGEAVNEFLDTGFNKKSWLQKLGESPQKFQNFSEETAKLNVFTEMRKQGLSVADAAKKAEEAIFSPYRISSTERGIMKHITPFYSFTRQAAPFLAKNLVSHPDRFTKYAKFETAMQNATTPNNEQNLPSYMKGMVRTNVKDSKGNTRYFNPQYLYPWGSFMDQNSGLPVPSLGLGANPAVQEYSAQKTGIDPYFGTPFVKDSMTKAEQLKARIGHAANTAAPTFLTSLATKIGPAIKSGKDIGATLLGQVGGMKTYPFDESAAIKSKNIQRFTIQKETNSKIQGILRNTKLTPEQRRQQVKDAKARQQERLQGL